MIILPKALSFGINPRWFSTSSTAAIKVAVCGASGGIGQPLSLLLKLNPLVTELSLYDIVHTPGVAADLSHIDMNSKTTGVNGPDDLKGALLGVKVVAISAGVPRKPGMSRDDLFKTNASIVKDLVDACANYCPDALIAIITNPINSCVPIAAEVLKRNGVFDGNRLFGITTLDAIRSSTFVGNLKGVDPKRIQIPVIGGHSGVTIIPVISQCKPKVELQDDEIVSLTKRIQNAGTEVVKAKAGAGSATLAMAYAGAKMVDALCRALKGEDNIVECSFVASNYLELNYFATPILLGPKGVKKNLGIPLLSKYENELVKVALPELQKNIRKGEDFVRKEVLRQ